MRHVMFFLAILSFCYLYCTCPAFYSYFISSVRAAWEGGGGGIALPDFSFCYLFPVQQTTGGIGHRLK